MNEAERSHFNRHPVYGYLSYVRPRQQVTPPKGNINWTKIGAYRPDLAR